MQNDLSVADSVGLVQVSKQPICPKVLKLVIGLPGYRPFPKTIKVRQK